MLTDVYLSCFSEIKDGHENRNGRNINLRYCAGEKDVEIKIECNGGETLVCFDIDLKDLICAIDKLKIGLNL